MAYNIGPVIGVDGEKEYREQIKSIIQETKTLKSEYQNLSKDITNPFKQAETQAKYLTQQIENQKEKVKLLTDQYQKVVDELGETNTHTQKYKELLEKAKAELKDLEKQLAAIPNKAEIISKKFEEVGKSIKSAGDKIKSLGSNLTMKVTVPITAAATAAVTKYAEVNKTMTLTNKVMGTTAEEAEKLNTAMEEAAKTSIYGMSDAAEAMLNFARAGLDANEAAALIKPAMDLAAGAGGDLNTVSAGLVATINGFGDSFNNASQYVDTFAVATNNSALDVDSLSDAMSIAAPVFKTVGYTVEDAALYMGIMANNGIEANKAANSLKTGFARLADPAKEGAEKIAELGLELFNTDGSMKDSVEIQKLLHDSFATLSEQEQITAASAIFGKEQMASWLALINTAPSEVDKLSGSLETAAGTTEEMANAMMSGFGGSLEQLKSSIDVAATSFGEALAPTISKVAEAVQSAADWFNSLTDEQKESIAQTALVVGAFGPLLTVTGSLVSSIGTLTSAGGKLVGMFGSLTHSAGTLTGGLTATGTGVNATGAAIGGLTAPIAVAVAAIGVFVGAFVTLYKTNDDFRQKSDDTWKTVSDTISTTVEKIKSVWSKFSNALSPIFEAGLDAVQNRFKNFSQSIQGLLNVFDGIFTGDWKKIITGVKDMFFGFVNTLIDNFKQGLDTIANIISKFKPEFPHINLPHFNITGEFSLNPPSVPHIDIDWYAKAMESGMRLDGATIFGASGSALLGGGEAGAEWVVGEKSLLGMIRTAVTSSMGYVPQNNVSIGDTTIIINTLPGQDAEEIADIVSERLNDRLMNLKEAWA